MFMLIIVINLYGCDIVYPDYEEPKSGSIAYLNFDYHFFKNVNAWVFSVFADPASCSGQTSITSWDHGEQKFPIKIKANSDLSIGVNVVNDMTGAIMESCNMIITFRAEALQIYTVLLNTTTQGCSLSVAKSSHGQLIPIPFRQRKVKEAMWITGSQCEPE